jgi:leucyl-tRNA synthetase
VEHEADGYTFGGRPVTRRSGKMGKSLKNGVSPDDIYRRYGADTLRLYEMATGPLEADRPWHTGDIVGVHRFLQRLWRSMISEQTGQVRVSDRALDDETLRRLHQAIMVVRRDFGALRFNTAIARLMELTSRAARITAADGALPRALAEPLVLMVAPLAPHIAEELWRHLGHAASLAHAALPEADQDLAAERAVSLPVQINGKTRFTMQVPAGADREQIERLLTAHQDFALYTAGLKVQRMIIVPGRIASVVAR